MSFEINCTQNVAYEFPMHAHKNYEIILYLEGQGSMRTETENIPFEEGTIVIVPPHVRHGSISKDGLKNISLEGDFEQFWHFDTVKIFLDNETREGTTLAKMIYDNRFGNNAYLSSLCTAYIHFLTQRIEIDHALQTCVQNIVFEISQNAFDSQIDLSSILFKSGYSKDYIRSCFKKITKKTPNEFLTEIRIKHACFLIDIYQNKQSLTEISEQCGYTDYIYFSKKFKSVMGLSPKEYRNQ